MTHRSAPLVVAPYRQPRSQAPHDAWGPWGVRHARTGDGAFTVCGVPTLTWHVFWTLPFDGAHDEACAACARALLLEVAPRRPVAG